MDVSQHTPLERRFIGSVRLATLHLWRVAQSCDLEKGFSAARKLGMINDADTELLRSCIQTSERLEAGEKPNCAITEELIVEIQACVLRLNSADPA